MLEILVESKRLKYDIKFSGRYCVILGASGVGKTVFVNSLLDKSKAFSKKILCDEKNITGDLEVYMFNNVPKGKVFINEYINSNYIFIIDDDDQDITDEFYEVITSSKNIRYIIISRNDRVVKIGKFNVNYSADCVYHMKSLDNGRTHYLEHCISEIPKWKYNNLDGTKFEKGRNVVLVEDSKSGYQFYSKLFTKSEVRYITDGVGRVSGKDSAIRCIKSLLKEYDNVFVLLDWCSYGSNIVDYLSLVLSLYNKNILMSFDILSFEYLLLNTTILNKMCIERNVSISEKVMLSYTSEERYYESLLEEVTRDTELHQKHGNKLKQCYISRCCYDYKKKSSCNLQVVGNDKIELLLKGTKFEYLLQYRRF